MEVVMHFFTSDTHFNHKNICRGVSSWTDKTGTRDFLNLEVMNKTMIDNINAVVQAGDVLYHLGDFAFLPQRQTREVLDCLNGNIMIILGNHDTPSNLLHDRVRVVPSYAFQPEDVVIAMSHYPEKAAELAEDIGFCGHIHTQWRSWKRPDGKLIYNLGTDVWNYHPVSLRDIDDDIINPQNRIVGEWKDSYHD